MAVELDVRQPVFLQPGGGEVVNDEEATSVVIKADLVEIAVTELRYAPGEHGPEAHVHHGHSDAFYVLEGELVYELAGERMRATAGSLVLAPPGVVHTFWNEGPQEARFLNIHVPSEGFAAYLRAMRDGREADAEQFDEFAPPPGVGRPASDALVSRAREGETLAAGRSTVVLKATGESTAGAFFVSESSAEPGFPGPPPHFHRRLVDVFYVLEGTLTMRIADAAVEARPGAFACVPPGVVRTFSNGSDLPVRFLDFNTPAGWENYVRELAKAFRQGRMPTADEIGRIASRYDFQPVT